MGYADRYPRRTTSRPECFGNESYHSADDEDCRRCAFYDSCRSNIRRHGVSVYPVNHRRGAPEEVEVLSADSDAGDVREGEKPVERFFRDCLTGACRGALWEGYSFFKKYRF